MSEQAHFDWTATVEENGVLIMEADICVCASVYDDGEVLIDEIELIKTERRETGQVTESGIKLGEWVRVGTIPFLDSSIPHILALGAHVKEILEADPDFIEKACSEAGLVYSGDGPNDPDGKFGWAA